MAKYPIKEVLGKMYVYASKNAINDNAALAHFGKAVAWGAGNTYAVGDRAFSTYQYKSLQANNTNHAVTDAAWWEFDKENFQTYVPAQTYNAGHKTCYPPTPAQGEHYICNSTTTGAFDLSKWTKVVISNKEVPFRLHNTMRLLVNADLRFVSYEVLDTVNNTADHKIHEVLSNGVWSDCTTLPSKYVRVVGQNKFKTSYGQVIVHTGTSYSNYFFYENLTITTTLLTCTSDITYWSASNCIYKNTTLTTAFANSGWSPRHATIKFAYKCIFLNCSVWGSPATLIVNHLVNCTCVNSPIFGTNTIFNTSTILRNNIIPTGTLSALTSIVAGNCDYNSFGDAAALSTLQTNYPLHNLYSIGGAVTLNPDYTLPSGSALIGTGFNENNIGAEGTGYNYTNATSLDSANGAVYRNAKKYQSTIIRDQVAKYAQGAGTGNNTLVLESGASSVNSEYVDFRITITSGAGAGQTKTITASSGSSKEITVDSAWSPAVDATSGYDILDGEAVSAVIDLGALKTIKKLNFDTLNYFSGDAATINQNVSSTDCRNDNPAGLTYELRWGLTSNLSAESYKTFMQNEAIKVDSAGKGCGDASYSPDNVITDRTCMRYLQIKVKLHK